MIINWLGLSAFKIQTKDAVLAIDPYDKIGLKMPKFQADILLISHEHDGHNNPSAIKGEPFLINGPGEYEVKNIFIYGINGFHDNKNGLEKGKITMYLIETEGIKIAFLSDIGQDNLTEAQLELFGNADILLVPVGGFTTINGPGASKMISQIQPRIVIPMHYKIPGVTLKLEGIDKFLKEFGVAQPEKMDKLKIAKKDLPQEETRLIILNKS